MVYKISYSIELIDNPEVLDIDYHGDEDIKRIYFHGCILTDAATQTEAEDKFLEFVGDGGAYEAYKVDYQITQLRAEGYKKYTSTSCRYIIDGNCILFDKHPKCSDCEVSEP